VLSEGRRSLRRLRLGGVNGISDLEGRAEVFVTPTECYGVRSFACVRTETWTTIGVLDMEYWSAHPHAPCRKCIAWVALGTGAWELLYQPRRGCDLESSPAEP